MRNVLFATTEYTECKKASANQALPLFPSQLYQSLPRMTPHVLRHTFCTHYANAEMDIKSLQYLMGHSDAGVTLTVYIHASYQYAANQLIQLQEPQVTDADNEIAV